MNTKQYYFVKQFTIHPKLGVNSVKKYANIQKNVKFDSIQKFSVLCFCYHEVDYVRK